MFEFELIGLQCIIFGTALSYMYMYTWQLQVEKENCSIYISLNLISSSTTIQPKGLLNHSR